ncbi:hypothetical protein [Falsiroseomonas sp. CW058]|uniref:hypothetical protein n=1 Tax=Falsiroseomonas sp. CW058 TaxID=3388664 RepID=UPI003D320E8C
MSDTEMKGEPAQPAGPTGAPRPLSSTDTYPVASPGQPGQPPTAATRPSPAAPRAPEAGAAQPAPRPAAARPDSAPRAVPPPFPAPSAFLEGPDTRNRDLLAFALAAEAGRPLAPGDIAGFRQKAEAELHAESLRILHNRVEAIRAEAVQETLTRIAQPMGWHGIVAANMVALAAAGAVSFALWLLLNMLRTGA